MSHQISPAPSAGASGNALAGLRRRLATRTSRRGEEGFLLLESVVAIALMTLLLAALASFFTSAVASTGSQRARQAAVQLASSQMEMVRALPASDLVIGRDSASVTSQLAAASPTVQPALAGMTSATDSTAAAGSGATAAVPTAPTTRVVGPTTYSVSTYLGTCRVRATSPSPCDLSGTSAELLRAVVAVTWPGERCPARSCSYVTSTVLSPDDDPVFALNEAPPPAPVVTNPGTQTVSIGGRVDLQVAVEQGTGVPAMTWSVTSGALPAGLELSTDGRVTGTPTGPAGQTPVTVRVKDAFLRHADAPFTWKVLPAPTITAPEPQSTHARFPVDLTPSSTCDNKPCRLDMTGAPAGLTMDASSGTITGRPSTPETPEATTSTVTVRITDAAGVAATATFPWVITHPSPLTATDPGPQKSTVGAKISGLQLSATGGSGKYRWSTVSGLPAGLSLSADGAITGTPTSTGAGTVTVRVTDWTADMVLDQSFRWTVVAQPTVGTRAPIPTTVGVARSASVDYTCPYASCTVTLAAGVPGIGLSTDSSTTGDNTTARLTVTDTSGTMFLAGTVQAAAVPSGTTADHAPVLTITDGAGGRASTTGSWRVHTAPALGPLASRSVTVGAPEDVPLAYSCPNAPCTLTVTRPVPGVGLNGTSGRVTANTTTSMTVPSGSGTVYVSGLVDPSVIPTGSTSSPAFPTAVSITDSNSVAATASASWTAYTPPTIAKLGNQAVEPHEPFALQTTATCPNGGCTYTAERVATDGTRTPAPISSTGQLTDSAPAGTYTYRVTARDGDSVTASTEFTVTSQTFSIKIPKQTTKRPSAAESPLIVTLNAADFVKPAAGSYTYAISGQPEWLSINASTGVLTATLTDKSISNETTDSKIKVTITSTVSPTSTETDIFGWVLTT